MSLKFTRTLYAHIIGLHNDIVAADAKIMHAVSRTTLEKCLTPVQFLLVFHIYQIPHTFIQLGKTSH